MIFSPPTDRPALDAGTFDLGDGLTIHRLGYGAMRITGKGIWGPPKDHDESVRVLKRAVELGIDFVDTADSYGPFVSEDLIAEALAPYDDVVIATKGGLLRTGPNEWPVLGKPSYLRQAVQMSLRRLKLDTIPLYQLHRIDPEVDRDEQFAALKEFQDEGWVRLVGLSEVDVDEIKAAQDFGLSIVTVQNEYNLGNRKHEDVVDFCESEGIGFIPWFPLNAGKLADDGTLDDAANEVSASPSQVALAWLLKRSPVMLPIPGTSSVEHLEENTAAAALDLPDAVFDRLDQATRDAS
ncbi:aldo/keto reductase [Rubrivirga sp. S365]|uniref:Aldo/keto reductase n=1 Tax=Rubrivirga litoralis TaxID=3075598 RepID=A0ABU3BP94_9BACT|nr:MULTISPECIES: aldo/keto reductase [unclassified Rubrivirga]MDT0631026.1 aldo/keto reductase [Rubrivirga sp. F394]MDT7855052.1 aldo/keto reductase [Rubrivirga sp. S365]